MSDGHGLGRLAPHLAVELFDFGGYGHWCTMCVFFRSKTLSNTPEGGGRHMCFIGQPGQALIEPSGQPEC